jgi:hypothetical protein
MSRVSEKEVLLTSRSLRAFRSGRRLSYRPRRHPARSHCPLHACCPRWQGQPDDWAASLGETTAKTRCRRATWPCNRRLDLLSSELTRIGP